MVWPEAARYRHGTEIRSVAAHHHHQIEVQVGTTRLIAAGHAGARWARRAIAPLWRAAGCAPRALLYPIGGQLLALATVIALLFAVGVPASSGSESRFLVVAYSAVSLFALVGYLLGRAFDEARRLSVTDPLTGLYNRRHFGQRLSEEAKRAQRYGHPSSVLCVDVDRLKAINDDFGHGAGDAALAAVCRALLDNVRTIDVVARVGGDEFVVLLPETSAAQAAALSHRVLGEVAWQGDRLASGLAVSIGIAELDTTAGVEPADLLAAADEALYEAKAAGGGAGRLAVVTQARGSRSPWTALDHVPRFVPGMAPRSAT
jgi:diguanylate cyclase (GGDEF)-like protein